MPAPLIDEEEEPYASSDDSDFAPDTGAAAADDDSASEGEDAEAKARSGPVKAAGEKKDVEDAGYDNSGDEAIIKKGARKRRKGKAGGEDDEEGGEGGLIKTRRQRAAEKEERKIVAAKGPVTIDVDAVWAQMLAGQQPTANMGQPDDKPLAADVEDPDSAAAAAVAHPTGEETELVRIRRTYNFAGRIHTEEKIVARDSAEAKLFIASGGQPEPVTTAISSSDNPLEPPPPRRTTAARKAFRSSFEPQLDVGVANAGRRTDLDLGVAARTLAGQVARAKKLNTVEKSRMDWAGFVDKEGLRDELELAGRSKGSYVARQDFLDRSEMRREDDARKARMAGRA